LDLGSHAGSTRRETSKQPTTKGKRKRRKKKNPEAAANGPTKTRPTKKSNKKGEEYFDQEPRSVPMGQTRQPVDVQQSENRPVRARNENYL